MGESKTKLRDPYNPHIKLLSSNAKSVSSAQKHATELVRLKRFLSWSVAACGGFAIALIGLLVIFPTPLLAICLVALTCQGWVYYWAIQQANCGRLVSAIMGVCCSLWSLAILLTFLVPVAFPLGVLLAIAPVLISLPHVKRRRLLQLMLTSTATIVLVSGLSLGQPPLPLAPIPDWLPRLAVACGAPVLVGSLFILFWQYNSRLGDTLAETQLANSALQKSEQELAAKVRESRERTWRERLINQLTTQIRTSLDLDTVLETTVQEVYRLMQIERCSFSWFHPQANPPLWETVKEVKDSILPSYLGTMDAATFAPLCDRLMSLKLLQVDNVEALSDIALQSTLMATGSLAALLVPIQTSSGRIGVLSCAQSSTPRTWTTAELDLLKLVVDQVAIAVNQAELYTQARSNAIKAQQQASTLQQTLQRLQHTQTQLIQTEKMSSLGQLVAGVAHEINNPINFIYGNLSHASNYANTLLGLVKLYQRHYPKGNQEIQQALEAADLEFLTEDLPRLLVSMRMGAERIRSIILSLRNFSRLDEAEMKRANLHDGLDSTLMILQNRLKEKPFRPEIQVIKHYGDLPEIECYPGQLNQVFMNILTNAIDILDEQGVGRNTGDHRPSIRIETSVIESLTLKPISGDRTGSDRYKPTKGVRICIADNGVGMSTEVRQRLFDPFFTTKPVGRGTGIGLSISYQIVVEKHGGQMLCFSEPGQGTELQITIPIR